MRRILLFLLVLGLWADGAGAETTRLTLREAVNRAMADNHLVKAAGHGLSAARQGVAIAAARHYPTVLLEENFQASNVPTQAFMMKLDQGRFSPEDFQTDNLNHPATQHDFKTAVTVRQTIYDPAIAPGRDLAARDEAKEALALDGIRQDVAFLVFRLFLAAEKATARLAAAVQAEKEARENLRLATVRSAAGTGLKSDELRARTHLAAVEQQRISARNDLDLASLQLARAIGGPAGETLEIVSDRTSLPVNMTYEELTRAALLSRSDLLQARAGLERSEAAIRLARSAYLPTVQAMASYQINANDLSLAGDNDGWMAGAYLQWPLFDGFKRDRQTAQALAGREAAAELVADKTAEIVFQVRESLLRREEMSQRLEVGRHALADAEETVRLLTRRFENSLATMVEMLDAQTALNQTRANLVETETEYALANGRVYYAAGLFLREILQ